jgi:hypothetical protein
MGALGKHKIKLSMKTGQATTTEFDVVVYMHTSPPPTKYTYGPIPTFPTSTRHPTAHLTTCPVPPSIHIHVVVAPAPQDLPRFRPVAQILRAFQASKKLLSLTQTIMGVDRSALSIADSGITTHMPIAGD